MVEAIQFAVRNSAGGIVRGTVGGEGNNLIQVGTGEQVSLNLAHVSVVGYERQGADLIVKLVDGSTVVLNGYYDVAAGEINRLYISANGEVTEVLLHDTGANGVIYADYGPLDSWNKFSTVDDLRFAGGDSFSGMDAISDEPAGMGFLAPALLGGGLGGAGLVAAGVGGAALLAGGGGSSSGGGTDTTPGGGGGTDTTPGGGGTDTTPGGGGTDTTPGGGGTDTTPGGGGTDTTPGGGGTDTTPGGGGTDTTPGGGGTDTTPGGGGGRATPTVDHPESKNTLTTNTTDPKLIVTGTGEPGDTVVVNIGGATETATIRPNGTWGVTFPRDEFPGDGSFRAEVTVTGGGTTTTLVGPSFIIDMTPPEVEITQGVKSTGDVENLVEHKDGVTIEGEGEPHATIKVEANGASHSTVVNADGTWSVTFTTTEVAGGEYSIPVKVTATDPLGNVTVINDTLVIDTETSVAFSAGGIAGDNTVNAVEAGQGVTMTGTAEGGAAISVVWNGATMTTTASADGSWSVKFPSAGIPRGTYDATATVTATDAAGNTATATRPVHVDTEVSVKIDANQMGDDYISAAERTGSAGVDLTGTADAGAKVEVTFQNVTRTVTANASGQWSANFTASEVAQGTYDSTVTVKASDVAGNSNTATHVVHVDTEVKDFARLTLSTGRDTILNGEEAKNGLTVTGTVEAGARSVMVSFDGGPAHAANVAADGTWTVTIPASQVPQGENMVPLKMVATDHVGNTSTINQTVQVDTILNKLTIVGAVTSDNMVNATESLAGVMLRGTAEAGSTVVVTLSNGSQMQTTAAANGVWKVTFKDAAMPHGDAHTVTATVVATDIAGNSGSVMHDFIVDTVAPDAPDVISLDRVASGLRGVGTNLTSDVYSFNQVDGSGAVTTLTATQRNDIMFDETSFRFNEAVPDGSYLVINNADVAGNSSSTLFIANNTTAVNVDLDRAGLTKFDFKAIDLTQAPDATLNISAAQIKALTDSDDRLIIKGDGDDHVNIQGGVKTSTIETIGGEDYSVYTLGNGTATLLVDDDIQTNLI